MIRAPRVAFSTPTGAVAVRVEASEATAVVEALFPDDRCDDPGGEPTLSLVQEADGFALRTRAGTWRSADVDSLLVRLELSLAEEMVRRSALPGLHAGGVVIRGAAVLFPGGGGSGKSSLTAALAMRGMPVLGDDVVLLDAEGHAHPFRRLLKIEEPARTLLGIPARPGPLSAAWPHATFCTPRDLGATWAESAPVREVVLLRRAPGAQGELVALRTARVLPNVLAGVVLSERVEAGAFDAVASALAGARCWELRYEETLRGADVLLSTLA